MSKTVSMAELAKMFNVSKVTISNALNDKEGVSPSLKMEIKNKAAELGWRLNSAARNLKTAKSYNIGMLISQKYISPNGDSYYLNVYTKLTSKLAELGYSCIFETLSSEMEENLELPLMYRDSKIDAIMVLGQVGFSYLKLFETINIPVLFVDFYNYNINVDSISLDNFSLSYRITQYLINKGHKNIGFVGNINSTSSIQDRFLGFYRALLENKLELNYKYIYSDRDDNGNTYYNLTIDEDLPTSIVCNNDCVAFKLIKQLEEMGKKVPDDVSVVAFDNTLFSALSEPKITIVDNDVDNFVEVATKVMLKKLSANNKIYGRIFVQGKIIERDSVREIDHGRD